MAFNGRFVLNMIHFATSKGANIKELVSITGLTPEALCTEECQLDSEVYNSIVQSIVQQTGDPFFGLHLGESLNLSAAGLVAQITQTSNTIKQALEYACEFAQLACSSLPMQLVEHDDFYKLTMVPETLWFNQSKESVRQTVDGTLVFTIREYHELTRKLYFPVKIHLPFDPPVSTSEYERLLQCPVLFGKNEIAIFFKKEHIEESIVTSDYRLLRILVAHAEKRLEEIRTKKSFSDQVKASVTSMIKPEFPTIEQVASHLNISVRTLQRKLANEGAYFKEIIDTLRKEFAFSYLRQNDLTVNQIAYLLNYTDASGFIRSFKRWTGVTPNHWRKRNSSSN